FRHRLHALLLAILFAACFTPHPLAAQSTPPQQPTTAAAQSNLQQAYTLPPDKLAKAIALSRIRNILDIAGSLWGIAMLWLLLVTRAAAGVESCMQRLSRHRWLQGLLFFTAFFVVTTLAGLPLDMYGHSVERSYQISVQSWGSW